jgi:hypothetical protein
VSRARGSGSLVTVLIGDAGRLAAVSAGLEAHPEVTVAATAESAEYAYGIIRRCLGDGLPVGAVFIDPLADRYDPHASSLFILETRSAHPDIVFVLLTSEDGLHVEEGDVAPELRGRIRHYYRLDPALPRERLRVEVDEAVTKCLAWRSAAGAGQPRRYEYDVALSFAGEDRDFAQRLARSLESRGVRVFYDDDRRPFLWGRNLYTTLYEVYAHQSRFCILLVSAAYRDKMWTNHERSAAQARALQTRAQDYILPIRIEDVEIPGLPPTVAYLPAELGIEKITDQFVRKIAAVS